MMERVGGGEAMHGEQRWAKMPAQHIQIYHAGPGDSTCLPFLL